MKYNIIIYLENGWKDTEVKETLLGFRCFRWANSIAVY